MLKISTRQLTLPDTNLSIKEKKTNKKRNELFYDFSHFCSGSCIGFYNIYTRGKRSNIKTI